MFPAKKPRSASRLGKIEIINAIDNAQKSVLLQAYEFTSKPIAESLIEAKKRGVDVKIILDKSQTRFKYSVINILRHSDLDRF